MLGTSGTTGHTPHHPHADCCPGWNLHNNQFWRAPRIFSPSSVFFDRSFDVVKKAQTNWLHLFDFSPHRQDGGNQPGTKPAPQTGLESSPRDIFGKACHRQVELSSSKYISKTQNLRKLGSRAVSEESATRQVLERHTRSQRQRSQIIRKAVKQMIYDMRDC